MEAIWTSEARLLPALLLLVTGLVLSFRGDWQLVQSARTPIGQAGRNYRWISGFRLAIAGGALALIAAGWAWHQTWLIALGLCIGFEEMIECSIVAWALRRSGE
jgi:fatty acid desaturase